MIFIYIYIFVLLSSYGIYRPRLLTSPIYNSDPAIPGQQKGAGVCSGWTPDFTGGLVGDRLPRCASSAYLFGRATLDGVKD